MGLKGNLAVVNLADVFQMLSRGKSTGLLRVQAPEGTRFIELQDGFISLAGRATQYIQLGDLLLARKAINDDSLNTALKIHKENGMVLGQVLIEMNYVNKNALEDALRFLTEEEICDLFTLREGDFDFLANASLDTKIAPGGGAVRLKIDPDSLLLEAARRADEWHDIEQRITTQSLLFRMTEDGMRVYRDADSISDEGRVIMRLLQANHTVEGIVQKSCLGRLNTNRMILELWDAQLVEPVPKSEYLNYAKLQMEAGQVADAHRMAVHASKVGSPDAIKAAIPFIEVLRKQLAAADDKPASVATPVERKGSSPTIKKPVVQNLIIRKRRLPLAKIALVLIALGGLGYGAFWYVTRGNSAHKEGLTQFDELKRDTATMLGKRKFNDALARVKTYAPPDPDLKAEHEKFAKSMQTEIETQLAQDLKDFSPKIITGLTRADLDDIRNKMRDYDGIKIEDKQTLVEQNKLKKKLPDLEELIRTVEFRARLDGLRKNTREQTPDQLIASYREMLKADPPEIVGKEARADLLKLLAPRDDALRLLAKGRDMMEKGDYNSARRLSEAVKKQCAGTQLGTEAEKLANELTDRETKAAEELSKIHNMILQRRAEEARATATALLASHPPAEAFADAVKELRKLQTDVPEADLKQKVLAAHQGEDIDAPHSRASILEVVNQYPFSEAAAGATLRVNLTSSPDGAQVSYHDKPIGKTPMYVDLPVMGPVELTFTLPGYEPEDKIECNFRGERIHADFVRKPQAAVQAPFPAEAGIMTVNDLLLLAGGNELTVCKRSTLEVLRRVNLEGPPLPVKEQYKTVQPRALPKGELKLRGLSANTEDAEAFAFVSCNGPYFFQIPTNGVEFHRIQSEPGAVGAPQMYRPKKSTATKLISLISRSAIDVYSAERNPIIKQMISDAYNASIDVPIGLAFDGDTYFVPRENNLIYAVEGYRGDVKWKMPCETRVSLPLALGREPSGGTLVGIADVKGHILVRDADAFGREKSHSDLDAPCLLGLAAAPNGFIAATDNNALSLVSVSGGPPVWTTPLQGKPLFTPMVWIPEKKQHNAVPLTLVCTESMGGNYMLCAYNLADGTLAWRGRIGTKPLTGTAGPDAVYVSTMEGELVKFDYTAPAN